MRMGSHPIHIWQLLRSWSVTLKLHYVPEREFVKEIKCLKVCVFLVIHHAT